MLEEPLPSPTGDNFEPWLCAVTSTYKSLNNEKRNFFLKNLIANSGPNQLNFLSTLIPTLTCRDFVAHLPLELVTLILKHLGGRQILGLRQVSKSWKDRIDSLTDLWQIKAFQAGVDTEAISSKYPDRFERAKVYKASYCLAEKFLSQFKKHDMRLKRVFPGSSPSYLEDTDFYLADDSITIGNSGAEYAEIFSIPGFNVKHSVSTGRFRTLLLYKNDYIFTTINHGKVLGLNVNFTEDSDDDSDTEFDVNGVPKKHIFIGHTSLVNALDVIETMGTTYVITGSADKTVKVWIMDKEIIDSVLFMTLDNTHRAKVLEIYFLPCEIHGQLRFISCDKKTMFMWSLDVHTRHYKTSQSSIHDYDSVADISSVYFDIAKPERVFISFWEFDTKESSLTCYQLSTKDVGIKEEEYWPITAYGLKAFIVGAGSRFVLLMCSISMQEFLLFDWITGCNMVMFNISDSFKRLPVKLYGTSWLDGFVFDKKDDQPPTIIGYNSFFRNDMAKLELSLPVLDNES